MVDESLDPHARMHDSFPRVDSGSNVEDRRDEENNRFNDSLYFQPTDHFDNSYNTQANEPAAPSSKLYSELGGKTVDKYPANRPIKVYSYKEATKKTKKEK